MLQTGEYVKEPSSVSEDDWNIYIAPQYKPKLKPLTSSQMDTKGNGEIEIFISHNSRDVDVAEALIELIRAALDVPHGKMRCTSVDGYRLPAGAATESQLRQEVHNSRCFVALLTPSSVQSSYVLFELGARWGAGLNCLPLLAKGLTAQALESPLSSLNALSCTSESQLHQLLEDIGSHIGRTPGSAATYAKHLQQVRSFQNGDFTSQHDFTGKNTPPSNHLGAGAQELLSLIEKEPNLSQRGIVEILREIRPGETNFFPRLQYNGGALSMKSRIFREAVDQLVAHGVLHSPEYNESSQTRTYEFRVQDAQNAAGKNAC